MDKERQYIALDLDEKKKLMVAQAAIAPNPNVIPTLTKAVTQFSMIGPKHAVLATAWVTPKRLREIGRELIRYANELEGKENLKVVGG